MTVKELIAALSVMPDDLEVNMDGCCGGCYQATGDVTRVMYEYERSEKVDFVLIQRGE